MNTKSKILRIILILFSINLIVITLIFFGKNIEIKSYNLSTFQQWPILIGVLLSFFIIGNYLIHKYYKSQHDKILSQIEKEKHQIFKNLKLTQSWNTGFRINTSDLIFVNNQIIVLIYNSNLNGLIRQAQPAILFYTKISEKSIDGISEKNKIDAIFSTTNGIKITTKIDALLNQKKISFTFETDQNNQKRINDYLTENNLL